MTNLQQSALPFRNLLTVAFVALTLTACGSDKIDLKANKNVGDAIEAATGPLQDLNLRRQEIPPLLVKAAMNPYARTTDIKCADIKSELAQLNEILGPDMEAKSFSLAASNGGLVDNLSSLDSIIDNADMPNRSSLMDTAGSFAKDTVISTIRSKTDILPFRNIIRKISGANRHAKRLATAYDAGKLRRAYLKGLAEVRFGERCVVSPIVVEAKADIPDASATQTPTSPSPARH